MVKKLFSVVFVLCCLAGFLYQAIDISIDYFSYQTTSKVFLYTDKKHSNPSIILCTRYTDILNRSRHHEYGIHPFRSDRKSIWGDDMSKLTVKDIFDLTPDPKEVIHGCQYRHHDHDLTTYNNISSCYNLFRIQKYHEGRFICYQFRTTKQKDNFDCGAIARSFYSPRELYSITLKPLFLQSNFIQLITFIPHADPKDLPLVSRRYYSLQIRWIGNNNYNNSKANYFLISGDTYSLWKQPKPYDTQCTDVDANMTGTILFCQSKCNIEAFKHHNLLPPNEINLHPSLFKHMSFTTMKNLTLIEDIKERKDNCSKKCTVIPCREWYSVTVSQSMPLFLNDSMTISSYCSNRPIISLHFIPRINLEAYLVFLGSCLGTWSGFSFLSLNPFERKISFRTPVKRCNIGKRRLQQKPPRILLPFPKTETKVSRVFAVNIS